METPKSGQVNNWYYMYNTVKLINKNTLYIIYSVYHPVHITLLSCFIIVFFLWILLPKSKSNEF